jgi:hypothetical protein
LLRNFAEQCECLQSHSLATVISASFTVLALSIYATIYRIPPEESQLRAKYVGALTALTLHKKIN